MKKICLKIPGFDQFLHPKDSFFIFLPVKILLLLVLDRTARSIVELRASQEYEGCFFSLECFMNRHYRYSYTVRNHENIHLGQLGVALIHFEVTVKFD